MKKKREEKQMMMFSIMEFIFPIMFLMVFGMFAVTFIKSISQWNKNNHSPRLTVDATVVGRRDHRSRHRGANNHMHTSTTYYVTFQFASGDRLELQIPAGEFGYIVEGDQGKLTFQGTRFLSFERT